MRSKTVARSLAKRLHWEADNPDEGGMVGVTIESDDGVRMTYVRHYSCMRSQRFFLDRERGTVEAV